MAKTITLRLEDNTYNVFKRYAEVDRRSISNCIETAALRHLQECSYVNDSEMEYILNDKKLVLKLKKGSESARFKKGKFVG